jgi:hypothetical protein
VDAAQAKARRRLGDVEAAAVVSHADGKLLFCIDSQRDAHRRRLGVAQHVAHGLLDDPKRGQPEGLGNAVPNRCVPGGELRTGLDGEDQAMLKAPDQLGDG